MIEQKNQITVSKSFSRDGKAQLFKDEITGLSELIASIKKAAAEVQKRLAAQSSAQHRSQSVGCGAQREPPVVARLKAHIKSFDAEFKNIGVAPVHTSYFNGSDESAGCACMNAPELLQTSVVQKLLELEYLKTHGNWVSNYISKSGLPGANSDIVSAKALTQILKICRAAIDARFFGNLKGTADLNEAFKPQFWQYNSEFSVVGMPMRGLPECRLTLEGSEIIAGLPVTAFTTEGLKNKIQELGSLNIESLKTMVEAKGGFIAVSKPGTLMVVPPGYLTIVAISGETHCRGLRWSFCRADYGKAEHKVITDMIEQMLLDFGQDDTLKKLKERLESD